MTKEPESEPNSNGKRLVFQNLENYLKNQQWYEADQETWQLILKLTKREKERWLREEDIQNFPCKDLLILDCLWVEYSKKYGFEFGFSVQKQIYIECGGRLDFSYPSDETWEEFCDRTAWKKDFEYVNYPQPFFDDNFMCVKGHLPNGLGIWGVWEVVGVYFFSCIKTCEV